MSIRLCPNGHVTGYRNCPMCKALADPQEVVITRRPPNGRFITLPKKEEPK